jgi:hypothetical protein
MIDHFISAEIPDPNTDPLGYILIAEHMMHGPCGNKDPHCPCVKKESAQNSTKRLPR